MGLSVRDRAILDFERSWWTRSGPKEAAIRTELGVSGTRYYEMLRRLVDDPIRLRLRPAHREAAPPRARPPPPRARRGHARRSGVAVTAPRAGRGPGASARRSRAGVRGAVARRPGRDRRHHRAADPRRQRHESATLRHHPHGRHVADHHARSRTTEPAGARAAARSRVKVYNASGVQGTAQTLTDKLKALRVQHAGAGQPRQRRGRAPSSSAAPASRATARARRSTASGTARPSRRIPSNPPEGADDADCIVILGTA